MMKNLLWRYRYAFLVSVVVVLVATLLLLGLSGGPQTGGFIYQLH